MTKIKNFKKSEVNAIREFFNENILKTRNCWFWNGPKNPEGLICIGGKNYSARKVSWWLHYKEWLDPTERLRVSCLEKDCVNPEHLYMDIRRGLK